MSNTIIPTEREGWPTDMPPRTLNKCVILSLPRSIKKNTIIGPVEMGEVGDASMFVAKNGIYRDGCYYFSSKLQGACFLSGSQNPFSLRKDEAAVVDMTKYRIIMTDLKLRGKQIVKYKLFNDAKIFEKVRGTYMFGRAFGSGSMDDELSDSPASPFHTRFEYDEIKLGSPMTLSFEPEVDPEPLSLCMPSSPLKLNFEVEVDTEPLRLCMPHSPTWQKIL